MSRPIIGLLCIFVMAAIVLSALCFTAEPAAEGIQSTPVSPLPSPDIPEGFLILDESSNEILEVPVEDFVTAAVALEMSPHVPKEALKAQAIAVRSYYLRLKWEYIALPYHFTCNSETPLVYASDTYFQELWGDEYEENMTMISDAVKATEGSILNYEDEIACAAFFPLSCGVTVEGEGFPYLISVASPYDSLSPYFEDEKKFTPEEVMNICSATWPKGRFNFELPYEEWFKDIVFSTGSIVYSTNICGFGVTGEEVREAFELRSASYQIEYIDDAFVFRTRGMGHGVGMSQYGAVQMASMGASCEEILAWYYPGTVLTGG